MTLRSDDKVEAARKELEKAEEERDRDRKRASMIREGACFGWKHDDFESADRVLKMLPDNEYGNREAVSEHLWFNDKPLSEGDSSAGISVQFEYPDGYGYLSRVETEITETEYMALRNKVLTKLGITPQGATSEAAERSLT